MCLCTGKATWADYVNTGFLITQAARIGLLWGLQGLIQGVETGFEHPRILLFFGGFFNAIPLVFVE
jgi:hypothetical protein